MARSTTPRLRAAMVTGGSHTPLALALCISACAAQTIPTGETAPGGTSDKDAWAPLLDAAPNDLVTLADGAVAADSTSEDASSLDSDATDGEIPEGASGPTGCDDLGKFPGIATCCAGEYCAGGCWPESGGGEYCVCNPVVGGCPWPEVCCANGCVAPSHCQM